MPELAIDSLRRRQCCSTFLFPLPPPSVRNSTTSKLCLFYLYSSPSVIWQQPTLPLSFAWQANASKAIPTHPVLGVTISAPGSPPALLLPGQYTSTTNPQLLHNLLTSSTASLQPSPGFKNSSNSLALPLNPAFTSIPSAPIGANSSTSLSLQSLALSSSVWIAVNSPSPGNSRVIIWDSIPDIAQLPTTAPSTLTSSTWSPPRVPRPGFTGSSCETCAPGFFGPGCAACPTGCTKCDDGLTGSGRCLNTTPPNAPASCNCVNGVCGANGSCTCTTGFISAANGTACSQCAPGFFLTSNGDCSICQIGCTACTDGTGVCTACKTGFTQDANDRTKCNPPPSITSSGTLCPPGAFSDGTNCTPCSPSCKTCTGGTSNDCVDCAAGTYSLNGACVSADANGVCAGSSLSRITISSSVIAALQCTGCVPGFFLSNGKCVASCPSGTFVSPQDNLTCTACDSSCTTCTGSATFCLTCASNQLAASGKCVATCPANTFSSTGSCLTCHPDCSTCSGASFNQCTSCPSSRPVLTNGRCLPTCSKTQFFDPTSSTCLPCDSSCSSCSGSGPSQCLACSSADQVLRAGTCVAAACQQSTSVVPGLGACLSELVDVPSTTAPGVPPLPSVTGLNAPTTISTPRRGLAWWEILLMALGCAFIFLVIVWLWRRRARKQRAQRTAKFAAKRQLDPPARPPQPESLPPIEGEAVKMAKIRAAEEARDGRDMDKLLANYEYPREEVRHHHHHHLHVQREHERNSSLSDASTLSAPSLYSQVTGLPHRVPEPKEPVKSSPRDITSRFSTSTIDDYYTSPSPMPVPSTSHPGLGQRIHFPRIRFGNDVNLFLILMDIDILYF
ncbi:TNFR/NGFR cysteine-rich region family protein [Mycena leptocephala]|nr:TNFR/NGFR cysteine-rich region family protein [Mycena leptocephala]